MRNTLRINAALLSLCLLAGTTTPAQAEEKHGSIIAVIVDDSSSMSSTPKNKSGHDPDGIAAFAASQIARIAPENSTIAIFTFASVNAPNTEKFLHLITNVNKTTRIREANAIVKKIKNNARFGIEKIKTKHGPHPYWFGGTHCKKAINAASAWVKGQLRQRQKSADSAIMFLSDGACTPKADESISLPEANAAMQTAQKHPSTQFYCAEFIGKECIETKKDHYKLPSGPKCGMGNLRNTCKKLGDHVLVKGSEGGEGVPAVLRGFGKLLDRFQGRTNNSVLLPFQDKGRTLQERDFDQASSVNLVVTEFCAPGKECLAFTLNDISDKGLRAQLEKDGRYEFSVWSWAKAKPYSRAFAQMSESQETPRFRFAYIMLYPDEIDEIRGFYSAPGRHSFLNSDYILSPKIEVFTGACKDKGERLDVVVINDTCSDIKDSQEKSECFELRKNLNKKKVCAKAQVMATNHLGKAEPTKWQTLHRYFLGPDAKGATGQLPKQFAKLRISPFLNTGETRTLQKHATNAPAGAESPLWQDEIDVPSCCFGKNKRGTNLELSFGEQAVSIEASNASGKSRGLGEAAKKRICWEKDLDGDGHLNCSLGKSGTGHIDDCNDTDSSVYPGNDEDEYSKCDDLDNNCNGLTDEPGPGQNNRDEKAFEGERDGRQWRVKHGESGSSIRRDSCDNDSDNDGCPDSCEPDADGDDIAKYDCYKPDPSCPLPQDVNKSLCQCECEWAIKEGERCKQDVSTRVWSLNFGDLNAEQELTQHCAIDAAKTTFKCDAAAKQKHIGLKLSPRNPRDKEKPRHSNDPNQCVWVRQASATEPPWKVNGNEDKALELTLEHKAVCGKKLYPKNAPDNERITNFQIPLLIEGDKSNTPSTKIWNQAGEQRASLRIEGRFEQYLDIHVSNNLTNAGGQENMHGYAEPTTIRVETKVGSHAKLSLKPKDDIVIKTIRKALTKAEWGGSWLVEKSEEISNPTGVHWVDCSNKERVKNSNNPQTLDPCTSPNCGESTHKGEYCLALKLEELATCPGGHLFHFCRELDKKGLQIRVERIWSKDGDEREQKIINGQKSENDPTVVLQIEKGFWDWFLPASGPGWFWLVIFWTAWVLWGAIYTARNTFSGLRDKGVLFKVTLLLLIWWAPTLWIWFSQGTTPW